MVGTVKTTKLRHREKFRADWSNRCGDMTIFWLFKVAAAAILHF